MRLERLRLKNYRNIAELEFFPDSGINVIYGDNAQGKTNLIEAIYLFTGQKSFRQCKESELLAIGQSSARLEADFFAGGRSQQAVLELGGRKAALLNELPVTPTELTGRFYAVVFSPAELALVQDGPAQRRSFLDSAISQVMPRYIYTLNTMNQCLSQRNALLSDMRLHSGMEAMLESWDSAFARLACAVIHARRRFVARLAPNAAELYSGIASGKESLQVAYQCSFTLDFKQGTEQMEHVVTEQLRAARGEDIRYGYTTLGPQRDDLLLGIDGVPARSFGSQGQQRSCALALKLAECRLIGEVCGEAPIVLLDDVFSELDKSRRDFFLHGVQEGQIFITSCEKTGLRGFSRGRKFYIQGGGIVQPQPRQKRKGVSSGSP